MQQRWQVRIVNIKNAPARAKTHRTCLDGRGVVRMPAIHRVMLEHEYAVGRRMLGERKNRPLDKVLDTPPRAMHADLAVVVDLQRRQEEMGMIACQ
ncbi:hypothetical protein D9M69_418790 [compost metagenome]